MQHVAHQCQVVPSLLKINEALKSAIMWVNRENIPSVEPEKSYDSIYQFLTTGNSIEIVSGVEVTSSSRRGGIGHSCLIVHKFCWANCKSSRNGEYP